MIEVTSNISVIVGEKLQQLQALKDNPDAILRTVAGAVLREMKDRIHIKGLASDGNKIGTYSKGYMVVRTGTFKNADQFKKGVKKGSYKNAGRFTDQTIRLDKKTGVFTGEEKVGTPRPKYNRTADTTVIVSLTSQLENNYVVTETPTGYGIGFTNPLNMQKAQWVEETYNKPILTQLTEGELQLAQITAQEFTDEYLKN